MHRPSNTPDTKTPPQRADTIAQLAAIPHGRVRTWFVPDVVGALADITLPGPTSPPPLVGLSWDADTNPAEATGHIVEALAGIAAARWPAWYGEAAPFLHNEADTGTDAILDDATLECLGVRHPALNPAWARTAVARARQGQKPIVSALPPAIQLQQLMLALQEPELILVLAMDTLETTATDLLAFARTATWSAEETGIRVAAFVPDAFRHAPELDRITYGAHHSDAMGEAAGSQAKSNITAGSTGSKPASTTGRAAGTHAPGGRRDEPLRLTVPPIIGRPHPSSPGEQLLAEWLARDAELGPLFAFNQRVDTTSGERFIVDLLWQQGRMVVEVDGFYWHSSPRAFAADRYRDYRLLCDGYRTLRLPHDEVMDDPALQCEKIRDVVRAIRKE